MYGDDPFSQFGEIQMKYNFPITDGDLLLVRHMHLPPEMSDEISQLEVVILSPS